MQQQGDGLTLAHHRMVVIHQVSDRQDSKATETSVLDLFSFHPE
jgi:hypothetical protein